MNTAQEIRMCHRITIVGNNVYKGEKGTVTDIVYEDKQDVYVVWLDLGGEVKFLREDIDRIVG